MRILGLHRDERTDRQVTLVGHARAIKRVRTAGVMAAAVLLGGCALAPLEPGAEPSLAVPPAAQGVLQQFGDRIESGLGPQESAYWLVDTADSALTARLALVDEAVATLDVQYFIWEPDASGRLMFSRLIHAADRGVRVRLLLDDLTVSGKDAEYAALDSHPLIEIRTFNPWRSRSHVGRVVEFMFQGGRLNHRMHLKTVLADGRFALIGGRNIGDRYFGRYDEFVQNDLDIMAAGPIVADVAQSFRDYWDSARSYPIADLASRRNRRQQLEDHVDRFEEEYLAAREKFRAVPLEPVSWRDYFQELADTYAPGAGTLAYDSPAVDDGLPETLYAPFVDFVASAREEVILATAYFVPEPAFVELLGELVARGVRVVLLTNSLASNNHTVAHTGYKPWRRPLLDAGVELYEASAEGDNLRYYAAPPTDPELLGFHSKAAVVDRRWSFVGSPNIDPRSMRLNTEIGMFVDSEPLAADLAALLERDIAPRNAWRVTMSEDGDLLWTGNPRTLKRQPARGFWQRLAEILVNLLPIKKQI